MERWRDGRREEGAGKGKTLGWVWNRYGLQSAGPKVSHIH